MTCAYDFTLPELSGKTINLADYRGRPILITNTASKCGFTPQYEDLQHLWMRYGDKKPKGLVVLGVPSNDFGQQEPGPDADIKQFCYKNYGVTFPMSTKTHVKGTDASPLFRWLRKEGGFLSSPRWNFYKYLINREGKLERWFTPLTTPVSSRMDSAIQRVLLNH